LLDRVSTSWGFGYASDRPAVQLLPVDTLQARQRLEVQQIAEGEGHLALPVGVDVLALYAYLGAVTMTPVIIVATLDEVQLLSCE